ncbi:DNA alkylation repair protein [Arthrobacter sp. M4]|uniref:DNA alkylation repair protein n=1 Tax=Arthrobacter sp. M4 TaxID=218160 RepID=UPI001CDB6F05|nr:DNA alkylation repair protein [Arthrobacter sp. M4]MCA4131227.1 DNA alkylation repair protein [Arthrobacter sp. M4]
MAQADLVDSIRSRLRASADPERAAGAQAYMKSTMPYLGVRVPQVRSIVRGAAKEHRHSSLNSLRSDVLRLWREAEVREERYAAIDLTGLRLAARSLDMLPVYEEFIRTGAWWDLVDGVSPRIRELLLSHPEVMKPLLIMWSRDEDLWIRRASITSQLGAKGATDPTLLATVIKVNLQDTDFFIRKAIGWALREYGKTDPEWVREFVESHADRISGLSLREATRNLPPRVEASQPPSAPSPHSQGQQPRGLRSKSPTER